MTSRERVEAYMKERGYAERITIFEQSTATVALAAAAIGVEEGRIAKSLSFKNGDNEGFLVVCAGDAKIDNPRFKETFKTKAVMPKGEEVEALIGHAIGGVCPFAVKDTVKVYLDESLKRFESVYPAAGDAQTVIHLNLEELENLSGKTAWVDVCKGWRDDEN